MKKLIIGIVIVVVVLLIVVVVGVAFFLDTALKRGVETVGPMLTKTDVKLDGVSLSLFSGEGKIKGLVVGNPQGYKTPSAISVGSAGLAIQPKSLFGDKVVVKSINVQAPEVTFETDLKGNNLSKLLSNIDAATGGGGTAKEGPPEAQKKANKKLQVDQFIISGGKVHVSVTGLMAGQSATVALPEIRLADLGTGPEGITVAELSKRVLNEIAKAAAQAASGAVSDLAKQAGGLTKELDKAVPGGADKATKALGDLLKKK